MKQLHLLVSGRVQGVGFRWSTQRQARQLGLGGYVRNLPRGDVEIVAAGDDAQVDAFVRWVRVGPQGARVAQLKVQPRPFDARLTGFDIRF